MKPTAPPDFLTVKEAAALMRISGMTVYRIIESGELPANRFGPRGLVRIDRLDLYRYMRQTRSGI